jgi:hypothetical protein
MATKIALRDEFVAPDDMASITWLDMEPSADDLALDVVPDMERDYFELRRIQRAEKLAIKRDSQAKHFASAHSEDFELLSEVCNELNMGGAHSVMLEYRPGHSPVLTAGAKHRYQLARVNGDTGTVYAKVTNTRMTPRGQESTTHIVGYAVESATLVESIRELAKSRVPVRTHSAFTVETGKVSRKKWQAAQSRKNSHDNDVSVALLRTEKQREMFATRATIESKLANSERVELAEWGTALGRTLTKAEKMAIKRHNARLDSTVATRERATHMGEASAMTRLVNSLERQ